LEEFDSSAGNSTPSRQALVAKYLNIHDRLCKGRELLLQKKLLLSLLSKMIMASASFQISFCQLKWWCDQRLSVLVTGRPYFALLWSISKSATPADVAKVGYATAQCVVLIHSCQPFAILFDRELSFITAIVRDRSFSLVCNSPQPLPLSQS
jgi:hypothetical protein